LTKMRNYHRLKRVAVALFVFAFALMSCAGPAAGAVGDMELMTTAPKADPFRPLAMTCKELFPVKEGRGAVNEKALVTRISGGSLAIMAAIDSTKPDADTFDVVRLDFSGKGYFGSAAAFELKEIATGARANSGLSVFVFGPTALKAPHRGKKTPVFVEGMCAVRDGRVKTLQVSIGLAAQGSCRFGDKVYRVRVIDADGRFGLNNAPSLEEMSDTPWAPPGAPELNPDAVDIIKIDAKNKTFASGVVQAVLGRLAYVDGQWYRVSVSDDGSKVSAEKIAAKTGSVSIAHEDWAATLVDDRQVLSIRGGKAPVPVPAGSYKVRRYRQYVTIPNSPQAAVLTVRSNPNAGVNAPVLDVKSGKTATLKIGSPVTIRPIVDTEGSGYSFGFSMLDSAQMQAAISLPSQPAPPSVRVIDSKGDKVHTGEMEYG
jgi:hypothetical protein